MGPSAMTVAFLAPGSSVHTMRWASSLAGRDIELHLITQHDAPWDAYRPGVRIHRLPYTGKLGYVLNAPALRTLLRRTSPQVISCHYASGYGTLAMLAGVHPVVLSVWGSDVYDFPHRSTIHRWLIRRNLRSADRIASTSRAMAAQVRALYPAAGEIAVTPFGVDTSRFSPDPYRSGDTSRRDVVIGTVKTLSRTYGIDTLIEAFARLCRWAQEAPASSERDLRLILVGGGPDAAALRALAIDLGIAERVTFVGQIEHDSVPDRLRALDIYVAASRRESFGVGVLEASSCGLPVVVADSPGLREVVVDGLTGLIVPRDSPEHLARALRTLVDDPHLRWRLGAAGRRHVAENYEWERCVDAMVALYRSVIGPHASARASAR